jgi:hypothetical protein
MIALFTEIVSQFFDDNFLAGKFREVNVLAVHESRS